MGAAHFVQAVAVDCIHLVEELDGVGSTLVVRLVAGGAPVSAAVVAGAGVVAVAAAGAAGVAAGVAGAPFDLLEH